MKKFNQVSQKLSAAVAASVFAASAFMLSACGGGDDSQKQAILKKYPNAKILSFSEIQEKFGVKDKNCLVGKSSGYYFVEKEQGGELVVLSVLTNEKSGVSGVSGTEYSIDDIKGLKSQCFN